ncbi:MAG: S1 family peptidase [Archangiaceae bacterium]|nr:S1 family peptidase [Archangiaceae bacterium]
MRFFLLASCLVCCAPEPGDGLTFVEQPILGGSADAGSKRSEVFLLGMTFTPDGGSSICSATLVSSHTLLTAAHCIDPARRGATGVNVIAVNKPTDQGLTSADIHHMVEYRLHPMWSPVGDSPDYDVAMLLLDSVPAGLKPVALSHVAPTVGESVTLVGYGRDSATNGQSSGTRRAAVAAIAAVGAQSFDFGTAGALGICSGDSGGPGLHLFPDGVERVIGVHSTTTSASCGVGSDSRVDTKTGFIELYLSQKDPLPDAGSGGGAGGGTAGGGSAGGAGTAGGASAGGAAAGGAGGNGGNGGGGVTADAGPDDPMSPRGCGCSGSPAGLLMLAALGWVRRRSRLR